MTLSQRVVQKLEKLARAYKDHAHIVILGREEYAEFLASPRPYYPIHIDSQDEWLMGLRVTKSRRPRYLCVVPKRLSKKVGFYTTWQCAVAPADTRAIVGLIID